MIHVGSFLRSIKNQQQLNKDRSPDILSIFIFQYLRLWKNSSWKNWGQFDFEFLDIVCLIIEVFKKLKY